MSIPDEWQPLPLDTDPLVLQARALDRLQATFGPDWQADESAPEVAIAEEIAAEQATTNGGVADHDDAYAAGVGIRLHQFPPIIGAASQLPALATVTQIGTSIPAGVTLTGTTSDGLDVAFLTATPVVAAALTVPLTLVARDVGTASNGVPAGPLLINNAVAGVVGIAATDVSAGGVDAETRSTYLGRLRAFIGRLSFGGVRADDLAQLALNTPGVQRVLAIDLLDATDPTSNPTTKPSERTATLYPIDAEGRDVGGDVAAAVTAAVLAVREVNFLVRIAGATRTPVAVAYTAQAVAGASPTAAKTAIDAAIATWLDPAHWGGTPRADGSLPDDWTPTPTVRYVDLIRVAATAAVAASANLLSASLNGGTADVTLPGWAALPASTTATTSPSTITGTVS